MKRKPYDSRTLRFAARYLRKYGRDDKEANAKALEHLAKHIPEPLSAPAKDKP